MDPIICPPKTLLGMTVRTRNDDEKSDKTARIPSLWKAFYGNIPQTMREGTIVYGVYSGYDSDHTGSFDVSAAIEKKDEMQGIGGVRPIELFEGKYLKFTPKTEGEGQVWQLWEQVWAFFHGGEHGLERAYTTDYEVFYPDTSVELYIAVT